MVLIVRAFAFATLIVLFAVASVGFAAHAQGGRAMVICSGDGQVRTIFLDPSGNPAQPGDHCPDCTLASPGLPVRAVLSGRLPPPASIDRTAVASASPGSANRAAPQARGPPERA